ncbi:MAG: hypothetical protein HY737_00255 [Candidatus Omnitrophica bacterium]|nr:hypothetical protein [Candidatus Omnitrophota bacterium]
MDIEQRFARWSGWLKIITSDITRLAIHRHVFWETSKIIRANPNIHTPSAFYSWMRNAYATDISIGIRRQLDTRKNVVSFANLLRELIKFPEVMSRDRFVTLYKGSVVERFADGDFDRFAGQGMTHIDSQKVKVDLGQLDQSWRIAERFVNEHIAHVSKQAIEELKAGITQPPTFDDLDKCQDCLEELLKKYILLFEAKNWVTVLPEFADYWQEIFTEPWIVPSHQRGLGVQVDAILK